jgi:TonB family protein
VTIRSRGSWRVASALTVVLAASYSPLAAADESKSEANAGWPELDCRPVANEEFYPPKALRLHESGAVLVEYSVNAEGVTEGIVVIASATSAESDSFENGAVRLISKVRCKTNKGWVDGGGPHQRFRLNVIFEIIDEKAVEPIDPKVVIAKVSSRAPRPPRFPERLR